jgi:hypothetical protein
MQVIVLPISPKSSILVVLVGCFVGAHTLLLTLSAMYGQTVGLAEEIAKAMSRTFPGISTDPQQISSYRIPTFQGLLRNALATNRRRIAVSGSNGMHCETMTDHEIRAFTARIQLVKQKEETVVRRYLVPMVVSLRRCKRTRAVFLSGKR